MRAIRFAHESWPLSRPFRIARGAKTSAEVVTVTIEAGGRTGRGEAVPYPRYGESPASVLAQLESVRAALAAGLDRAGLAGALPAGAARNAADCALWDLEGAPALPPDAPATAMTVVLDTPAAMAEAAAAIAALPLLKVKVDAVQPAACLRAVRAAAPAPRLIVDPNESWTPALLGELQPLLGELRVDLVEQPLPADADAALAGFARTVPICADESLHTRADLARLRGRYDAVNVKLDKAGGLTEALALAAAARAQGFALMVGCMICTSLAIAPALRLAADADFVDLDGPLWLRADRPGGVRLADGRLRGPESGFWS